MNEKLFREQMNTWFYINAHTKAFYGTGASYDDVCHINMGFPM